MKKHLLRVAITALCLASDPSSAAFADQPSLQGIWEAKHAFPTGLSGEIMLRIDAGQASATIGGQTATAQITHHIARLVFANDMGALQVRVARNGSLVSAEWIQPQGTGRLFSAYATPLNMATTADGGYTGTVTPLGDHLTFFLLVADEKDGGYPVTILNPEGNRGRFYTDAALIADENGHLRLDGKFRGRGDIRTFFEGSVPADGKSFTLEMPNFGGAYEFRPIRADSDYYPRPPSESYSYHRPEQRDDGIEVGSPEEAGLSRKAIDDFMNMLSARRLQQPSDAAIHAVLIMRNGKLVVEEYFHGHKRDTPHDLRSASKSVTGTMYGLLKQAGRPVSLDDGLYDVLDPEGLSQNPHPGKADIKLRHLLTMSSGLDCDDGNPQSAGNEDTMQDQSDQPDWIRYALDLTYVHAPGSHAAYCSAGMNLAGGMLAARSGEWMPSLVNAYLARPLQFGPYYMNLMPEGRAAYSGGGMYLQARDFLKLGKLMLDGGAWKGKQLMAPDVAKETLSPLTNMGGKGYGYGWWRMDYDVDGKVYPAFFAGGNGGQQIVGVPSLNLLFLTFGGAYSTAGTFVARDKYMPEFVIPMVVDR